MNLARKARRAQKIEEIRRIQRPGGCGEMIPGRWSGEGPRRCQGWISSRSGRRVCCTCGKDYGEAPPEPELPKISGQQLLAVAAVLGRP